MPVADMLVQASGIGILRQNLAPTKNRGCTLGFHNLHGALVFSADPVRRFVSRFAIVNKQALKEGHELQVCKKPKKTVHKSLEISKSLESLEGWVKSLENLEPPPPNSRPRPSLVLAEILVVCTYLVLPTDFFWVV